MAPRTMGQRVPAVPLDATIQRLAAILRRGYFRRHETRIAFMAAAASVLVLLLVHWAAVWAIAGAPGPVHQLAYPPILLAAYLFGLRGALLVTIVPVLVSGPIPLLVEPDPTTWIEDGSSLLRVAMFLMVAVVTGVLFDHLRAALDGWRTTAVRVAQREREGMVALARGAEAKDTDTGDHIVRVQLASMVLAEATGVSEEAASAIGWSAMLHDVGKLHVPDAILLKPGPLTAEEWELMRRHTTFGEQILRDGAAFEMARRIARWHHENIDGSGYPDGLRGEQIPFEARIVRVADAFDAMTHDRPYKRAISLDAALDELQRCAGSQFDPELVRLFVQRLQADPSIVTRLAAHQLP